MYICTNCGAELEELYRRYCPSVLKVLKCESCGLLADKYIECDPIIVLVDLILAEKQAYRHLLHNSSFKSYWKLMIVLWLAESFRIWSLCDVNCAISLMVFLLTVTIVTESLSLITHKKPKEYSARKLCHALIIGGCGKLFGLLGVIWKHIALGPHYILIHGYTALCLLTAYSVVCRSGTADSLIILTAGFLVYNYVFNALNVLPLNIYNIN
ncbi:hypothetical protein KM043_000551 [Ampulex compressa]|nr:hypothetical protein KM043_000551 [Ampulex compressa]